MAPVLRQIPGLGEISTEITYFDDSVAQFRGIQYGVVPQRFQQPRLLEVWEDGRFEASKFGFRLGAFGFMASDDILRDNQSTGDKGVGNYALHDQYMAMLWVKKYIRGFGGDAERITAVGQSSGASDLHILMMSPLLRSQQLLQQAIVISGNSVIASRELDHQQHIYDKFLEHLGISTNLPSNQRLERLRSIKQEDLVSAYICLGSPLPNWQATVDGVVLEALPTCDGLANQVYAPSIKRIMVGFCEQEGILWGGRIRQKQWTVPRIIDRMATHYDPRETYDILQQYEITDDGQDSELVPKLADFCGGVEFRQPLYELVNNWKQGDAYLYRMRFINHFDGMFSGRAHHGVDLLFFFQTYNHLLSKEYAAAAEEMGKHFVEFLDGVSPWAPFTETNAVMNYGPDHVKSQSLEEGQYRQFQPLNGRKDWFHKCTSTSRAVRNETIYRRGGE
ncbi:unnamed protein product [Clonostachys solani]|uniref:Carboxylesterase type B domain-containing protein n=1 Tax=Clonostachys solani TaxID=160281 RepID=A0A9P0ER02_9HYPO|nr:unnamed protein product [Clonostachys solani]